MLILQGVFGMQGSAYGPWNDPAEPNEWLTIAENGIHLRIHSRHKTYRLARLRSSGILIHEHHLPAAEAELPERRDGSWLEILWGPEGVEVVSDRIGAIPVHWAIQDGRTWLASRLTDLAALMPRTPGPDRIGALSTIFLDNPWGNRTLLEGVSLLPPASRCHFANPGLAPRCTRYWSPPPVSTAPTGPIEPWLDEAAERLASAHQAGAAGLEASAVAMPVTAGLDSRCNLALHPELSQRARLFHCHDLGNVEWPYARKIGRYLGRPIERFDSAEGMRHAATFDPALGPGDFNIAHWRLVGTARRLTETGSTATIDGFLQDLLFKATFLRDQSREAQIEGQLARMRYNAKALGFSAESEEVSLLTDYIREEYPSADAGLDASQLHYLENRSRRLVYNIVRLNQNYLDVRTPALDHQLMDFALRLPWELRRGSWLYRRIIHRLDPNLAAIPYDKTGLPLLDPRPRSRGKAIARQLRPLLDRAWPGRPFLQPPEGNFARIARRDQSFRSAAATALSDSEWLESCLGTKGARMPTQSGNRLGQAGIDCLGGMLTISLLERAVRKADRTGDGDTT
ncbi:hypothetical protein [Thioalkalivibrio sp. ALJ7]|uniref:hypothetical protein n=1 Tax=Thioalkalivibrio sp. ALJ7 TaxID=1158756 RepID=UPI00036A12C1|nr:hypothetical protein [Thioalkalivibrio sp. ALJ7]